MSGLREALMMLVRRWEWLWRRERHEQGGRRSDDRQRFWMEFRRGQRQAEKASLENAARTGRDA